MLILLLVPFWFAWYALNALPHARTQASSYAASPKCESSTLLGVAPPQFQPSAAPNGMLCEVQTMTAQQKRRFHGHTITYYEVILIDQTGTQLDVQLDSNIYQFWHGLQPPAKVNVQLVEGKVAMIANGAALARTVYHPEAILRTFRTQLLVSGAFSLPFFGFLGISIRSWVKKSRRSGSGAFQPPERAARAWGDSPDAPSQVLECPNFQGRPLAQARQELEAAGYRMGRISFIASASLPAGTIVVQVPPPGSQVAPGTAFTFQVSIEGKTRPSNS